MAITGGPAAVIVGAGTSGEAERGEAPEVADGGQALVLHPPMEHDATLATGASDRRRAHMGLECPRIGEASAMIADLGQDARGRKLTQAWEAEEDGRVRVLVQVGDGGLGEVVGSLAGGLQLLEQRQRLPPHGGFDQSDFG